MILWWEIRNEVLMLNLKPWFWKQKLYVTKKRIIFPPNIYLFKVNNKNSRKKVWICSKLKIKTPERHQWRRSGAFIVNLTPLTYLTYLTPFSSVSIVDFEQVNASWNVTLWETALVLMCFKNLNRKVYTNLSNFYDGAFSQK